jgi:rSAM/selenodomain-associated transferase 1
MAAIEAFSQDAGRLVLIGTDCPGLSANLLTRAFDLLAKHDLVLGPALDGGYYLIGLNRPAPALFSDITWGATNVLAVTLDRAASLHLTVAQLEPLSDVDRPEDLLYLNHHSDAE